MGTNLFVGNLPFDITEARLAEVFSRAGTVTSVQVITDKFTGQSRGFGFVEKGSEAEAAQAEALLNGHEVQGRALTVNEARPRAERGERRSAYAGGSSGDRRNGNGRSRF